MAFTPFTGKGMTITADAHSITGLTGVSIGDDGKPPVERLDKTTAISAAYEFMDDPLGPKGDPKSTVVVSCWDSTVGVADTQLHHLTLGGSMAIAFANSAVVGDDKYSHTMRLQNRTTKCGIGGNATVAGTFEALTNGTWGTV